MCWPLSTPSVDSRMCASPSDRGRGAYSELCDRVGDAIPLMARAWWLEAVSRPVGKEWGAVLLRRGDGGVVGAAPYQLTRRGPLSAILMPQLTQASHVWTAEGVDRSEALSQVLGLLLAMCRSERVLLVQFAGSLDASERRVFAGAGFSLADRVTYRVDSLADMAAVERGFADFKRRKLRRAEREGFVLDLSMSAADLYAEVEAAFRGSGVSYPRALLAGLHHAASVRGCAQILCARAAATGQFAAAVMVVCDSAVAYYLVTPRSAKFARSGAMEWLTRECMRWAAARGLAFDFEGSMSPSVAFAYRAYGAAPLGYTFATWYASRPVRWLARRLGA